MAAEPQIEERMLSFFKQEKYRSLLATAAAQRKQSIPVDHSDLISFDEELSHLIVNDPLKYLPILDRAAYKQLQVEDPDYAATLKEFKARIFNLPDRIPIREIRSHHLGKLIAIDGIMVRASTVRPMLKTAVFACSNCGAKYLSSEDSSGTRLRPPERCERCRGRKFEMIPEESEYIDFQLVGIQEKPEDLPPGQIPRVIDVELKGDIVDVARPGDRVIVTGILRTIPERDANTPRRTSKMYLEAVSVETASKEPETLIITPEEEKLFREMARDPEIHKKLMDSIAPSLYGLGACEEGRNAPPLRRKAETISRWHEDTRRHPPPTRRRSWNRKKPTTQICRHDGAKRNLHFRKRIDCGRLMRLRRYPDLYK
jgi:replicative DNA helicase Mcm